MARAPSRAFAENWRAMLESGIAPIPITASTKRPRIKWKGHDPFNAEHLARLADKMPNSGIGILTGESGLTVFDIDGDAPRLADVIQEKHGKPGAIVKTPSGGSHLYYKGGLDRSVTRKVPGFIGEPVDLRSAGGLIVAPPTVSPRGPYRLVFGSFSERDGWPVLDMGTRPVSGVGTLSVAGKAQSAQLGARTGDIGEGERQQFLFGVARDLLTDPTSPQPPDWNWLLAQLRQVNEDRCCPPALERDVLSAAQSAWRYFEGGACWPAGILRPHAGGGVPASILRLSQAAQDVYRELRSVHWRRPGDFRIVVRGVAKRMGRRAEYVQRGKRDLIDAGEIIQTRAAYKRGEHREAAVFRFRDSYGTPSQASNLIAFPSQDERQTGGSRDEPALSHPAA